MKRKIGSLLLSVAMVLQLSTAAAFAGAAVLPPSASRQPFVVSAGLDDFTPTSAVAEPSAGGAINNLPADYRGPLNAPRPFGLTEEEGPLLTAKNVVLPVRFQGEEEFTGKKGASAAGSDDDTEYFTKDVFDSLELMYNSGEYNLADYFSELTFGEMEVESTVAHGQDGARSSYETRLPRGCYEPLSVDNPDGCCEHFRIIPVYDGVTGEPLSEVALIPEIRCAYTFENTGFTPPDEWSDVLNDHVPAEKEEEYVCPHMDVWYTCETGEDGGCVYTLHRELASGEPSAHQWDKSLCIDSYESNLRVYALFNECIAYLETYFEGLNDRGYTSTSLWYSGTCDVWGAPLWPQTGAAADYGKTDTEKLTNYMSDFVENSDVDAPAYRLIAEYIRTRYIDVAENSPGAVLWGFLHNEGGYYENPDEPIVNSALNDYMLGTETTYDGADGVEVRYPSIGTACHEYGHVLGLPDEYCYENQTAPTTVYRSIMNSQLFPVPQYASAYTVAHYWPGVFAEGNVNKITESGVYTLDCFSDHTVRGGKTFLYMLDLPTGDGAHPEKLALEYRSSAEGVSKYESTKVWRNNINSGLVLYRIDEESERDGYGNMMCPAAGPFAITVCRIEGQGRAVLGELYDPLPSYDPQQPIASREYYDINASALTDRPFTAWDGTVHTLPNYYGSADLSQTKNVIASQRTGKNTGITITDVTVQEEGRQISFRVTLPEPTPPSGDGGSGTPKTKYTISASATEGGSISPDGDRAVSEGTSARFTVRPEDGYRLASLWVDGRSVPLQTVYVFENVKAPHTIHAVFVRIETMYGADAVQAAFPDLAEHWAKAAVGQMLELGLMNGTGRGFEPDAEATRAMLLTILYRCAGSPETDGAGTAWYAAALSWAKETSLSDGSSPEAPVTREQAAALLWRMSGAPDGTRASYADRESVSPWAAEAMDWAVDSGILTVGDRGFTRPGAAATRAELAVILSRYLARSAS